MSSTTKTLLFGISVGVNIAFFSVWGFFVLEDTLDRQYHRKGDRSWHKKQYEMDRNGDRPGHWFYHEKLGVSDSQWKQIRPRLRTFHRKAYDLCQEITTKRNQLFSVLGKQEISDDEVDRLQEDLRQLREEKQQLSVEYFRGKRERLTSDQRHRFFKALQRKPRCDKHARFFK